MSCNKTEGSWPERLCKDCEHYKPPITGPDNCKNPECPYGHYREGATQCCCACCVGMVEDKGKL